MRDFGMWVLGAGCGGVVTVWGYSIVGLRQIAERAKRAER